VNGRTILVYHPEAAAAYAAGIRLPAGSGLQVAVAATPAAARAVEAHEILYAWNPPAELLRGNPRLRWIQVMGAGVERVLVPGLPPAVTVTRAAGIFGPWMAQYTLAWCLWSSQRIELFRGQQRRRRWRPVDPDRLHGRTLCVVGLGDIGRAIARAAAALGLRVLGVSRGGRGAPGVARVGGPRGLRRALGEADYVVLAVPLTPATRGLVGARELAAMKRSAWLLNVARGPVVDEAALLRALRARRLAGAVLDVFDREPLPRDHPFWRMDNVVVTPHVAGPSVPEEITPIFNDNLRRYLAGRPLRHVVDRRRGY
jgi:phosphoglycerate dehydrogenase-like enzyme